jgi:Per os infectivity factor 3
MRYKHEYKTDSCKCNIFTLVWYFPFFVLVVVAIIYFINNKLITLYKSQEKVQDYGHSDILSEMISDINVKKISPMLPEVDCKRNFNSCITDQDCINTCLPINSDQETLTCSNNKYCVVNKLDKLVECEEHRGIWSFNPKINKWECLNLYSSILNSKDLKQHHPYLCKAGTLQNNYLNTMMPFTCECSGTDSLIYYVTGRVKLPFCVDEKIKTLLLESGNYESG